MLLNKMKEFLHQQWICSCDGELSNYLLYFIFLDYLLKTHLS